MVVSPNAYRATGRTARRSGVHEIAVPSDTTVIVTGLDTVTRDGVTASAAGRVTFVVAQRGAAWRIVHFHRSVLPN
jgi:hypothetical protein